MLNADRIRVFLNFKRKICIRAFVGIAMNSVNRHYICVVLNMDKLLFSTQNGDRSLSQPFNRNCQKLGTPQFF